VIASDRPVIVYATRSRVHANSVALRALGFGRDKTVVAAVTVGTDAAGEPDGVLSGSPSNVVNLTSHVVPPPTLDEKVHADQIARLKRLGVAVSAQFQPYVSAEAMRRRLGRERADHAVPMRDLLDAGIVGPDQRIGRLEALRVMTLNNAWLTFEEQLKGSIETGKLADFVILSDDLLTVPEEQIKAITPLATYVGGRAYCQVSEDIMDRPFRLDRLPRRSFLSRLSAGATALAAVVGVAPAAANAAADAAVDVAPGAPPGATTAEANVWKPARHPEDDWFDQTSAQHRFFFDTSDPDGFGQALGWARNFLEASISGYKLTDADAAVIICARHRSTAFAFGDDMWAKYGAALSERANHFVDPKTKQVPTVNVYLASGSGGTADRSLGTLLKRGVRLAVCGMATRRIATVLAQKQQSNVDEVVKELTAHLVPNAHMVPAGIVAVSRAQERGYTLAVVAPGGPAGD
jgi:intracellular sulfur oxidation DsrE/DsrF family protein